MTLISAFLTAIQVGAGIGLILAFVGAIIAILGKFFANADDWDHPYLSFISGMGLLFVLLVLGIYCGANADKWFGHEWFPQSHPTTAMVLENNK